ncbi:hypothetical protein RRG08_054058 [Elysia crispata]|uniref:Saposin B-type domain-containing protein n=1 Tax=Elysia crispata TaxID=231223 RepID=A0AAE1DEJ9_9GAST|nr:hypothetical protein RRG08_054058 [Elysia crispata]
MAVTWIDADVSFAICPSREHNPLPALTRLAREWDAAREPDEQKGSHWKNSQRYSVCRVDSQPVKMTSRFALAACLVLAFAVSSQAVDPQQCWYCQLVTEWMYRQIPKGASREQVEDAVTYGCQGLTIGVGNTCWMMRSFHYTKFVEFLFERKTAKQLCQGIDYC